MAHEIEQGIDGLYGLCIFNAENSTDDEMRDVFGKFGEIIKLHRTKNLVFIRYSILEEAVKAYELMLDSPLYTVKPATCKKKSNTDSPGNQWNRESFGSSQRNEDMNRRNGDFRGKGNDGGDYNRRSGGGDFNYSRGESNSFSNDSVGQKPPVLKVVPANQAVSDIGNNTSKIVAKEVVLGNLHPDMKQMNIYELCNKCKANPLHVYLLKLARPPNPDIHFAYVYVKTEKEVKSIVDSLNNLQVNGYQLVVSSVEKLEEEGRSLVH